MSTDHTIPLGDSGWRIWRLSALRGAGFPATLLDRTVDADLARDAAETAVTDEEFADRYRAAAARQSTELAAIARDPAFREAVAWQSPHLLATCIDKVAVEPIDPRRLPGSKQRQRELTTAAYIQRYALKNDSIGFFGPVGWARWTEDPAALVSVAHRPALSRRTVCFETWAADAVAGALSRDLELVPWLLPVRAPQNLHGPDGVITPRGRLLALSPSDGRLVAACDGATPIGRIACDAVARGDYPDAESVHRALLGLQEREVLRVDLEVVAAARPLAALRTAVEAVPAETARRGALTALDELEARRGEVAAAAGDPDKLLAAQDALQAAFVRLTGEGSQRRAGESYAGRTLVYEDTVRAVDVTLGAPMLAALARPLGMLLDASRWLVAEAAAAYRRLFDEIFDRLCARRGQDSVPLAVFYGAATPDLVFSFRELPPIVQQVVTEFQRRWQRVLEIPDDGVARHDIDGASIVASVAREFPHSEVPWSAAVHHAPDLMIAAADVDAVRRGEFLAVLGELHAGANTIESRLFVEQSPDPAALMAAEEADHGTRRIVPVLSKESSKVNSRTTPSALLSPGYTYWAMYPDGASRHDEVVPAAALRVHRSADALEVRGAPDGRALPLIEVLGEVLGSAVMNGFSMLPSAGHRPRVTVDNLVVSRESWRIPAEELAWAAERDPDRRFRGATRWRLDRGLPRRVFYRVPVEDKPLFLDFAGVSLVEMLARSVRRTLRDADPGSRISFSEALPDTDQTWLRDADDQRYTSEFRIIAVADRASS
ncbi:lantibiotic dehydratase [Actinoalloteichus hymeniacidonis]|uniref:Lantibiotic dehydratase family protein n=1 Tax=Actinoalloteichus hymeniacidonis TaxID=340345 RepID=A0AAC9MYX5_9PSEU|nr:lantibiotic dehydratase [Actinoalloteichus hymeniacidonis]AOS63780.1 lantibiotic dehydratase family protein [Actinoalloteichus hymeniacidonis]MBB5908166.1 hypothetical protein [Actinoalloteichus hymeniacidonis]